MELPWTRKCDPVRSVLLNQASLSPVQQSMHGKPLHFFSFQQGVLFYHLMLIQQATARDWDLTEMWIPSFLAGSINGHACRVFCCLNSSCHHCYGNASHSDQQPQKINVCDPRGIVSSGCWCDTISTFISKLVLCSLLMKWLLRISFQRVGGVPCQGGSDDESAEQRHSLGVVQRLYCSCHHLITVVGFYGTINIRLHRFPPIADSDTMELSAPTRRHSTCCRSKLGAYTKDSV